MLWISWTAIGSTPAKGSSSRMRLGREASARVTSRRRHSPPESVSATLLRSRVRPSSASSSSRRAGALGARGADGFEDGQDVVLDRHLAEDRLVLGEVAESSARAAIHRPAGDVLAEQLHGAFVRADHPDDHAEGRGLARAVGAQQADDLAAMHAQRDFVHHAALLVGLDQVTGFEEQLAGGFGTCCGWHVQNSNSKRRMRGPEALWAGIRRTSHTAEPISKSPELARFSLPVKGLARFVQDSARAGLVGSQRGSRRAWILACQGRLRKRWTSAA
jgi:hypothetical protein